MAKVRDIIAGLEKTKKEMQKLEQFVPYVQNVDKLIQYISGLSPEESPNSNRFLDMLGEFLIVFKDDFTKIKKENSGLEMRDYSRYIQIEEVILNIDEALNTLVTDVQTYYGKEGMLCGSPAIFYLLGALYDAGIGETLDKKTALVWYLRAALRTHLASMRVMYNYCKNEGNEGGSIYWLKALVKQGDAAAQYDYGKMLLKQGNIKIAMDLLNSASDKGYALAEYELAEIYASETIDPSYIDEDKVCDLYKKAADHGHARAQYVLGRYLEEGSYGMTIDTEEALQRYKQAAGQGIPEAQFNLARCYFQGIGGEKNLEEAYKWCLVAAENGNEDALEMVNEYIEEGCGGIHIVEWFTKFAKECNNMYAQWYLGMWCRNGEKIKKDLGQSYLWLKQAADQGHSQAQFEVAKALEIGEGVDRDEVRALEYLQRAAKKDVPEAQNKLGIYWENGIGGMGVNEKEAFKLYEKAAREKCIDGQCNLARCYKDGIGITKSEVEAFRWYRKAAESGHKEAQFQLALCYEDGIGVTANLQEAFKWYEKAADNGHPKAQNMIGHYYENGTGTVSADEEKAFRWYKKAAEQSLPEAQYNLALCYEDGIGVTQNWEKASAWYGKAYEHYRKAAEKGDANAQNILGRYLEDGLGSISINKKKATEYYEKAALRGLSDAQLNLARCYNEGIGVERNEKKAYYWGKKAADQEEADAQYMVGYYHERGLGGIMADIREAINWYKKAENNGSEEAKSKLKSLGIVGT